MFLSLVGAWGLAVLYGLSVRQVTMFVFSLGYMDWKALMAESGLTPGSQVYDDDRHNGKQEALGGGCIQSRYNLILSYWNCLMLPMSHSEAHTRGPWRLP